MIKTKPFSELAAQVKADPVRRARIEREKRTIEAALALAQLRSRQNVTQKALAESLGVSQANISRIERGENLYLSTLRDYVAALGGELEVMLSFRMARWRWFPLSGRREGTPRRERLPSYGSTPCRRASGFPPG
jgi:transcriptional regulator with XRE-family HTH domain